MELYAMTLRNRPNCVVIAGLLFVGTITGCQGWNKTQQGAGIGALLGAGTGAIIGHQTGNRDKGALIGALAGAAGGGLLGNAADKEDERNAAVHDAHMTRQQARAEARAMDNRQVIKLTRQGISDDLIIQNIHNKGGMFDTSADGIGYLKEQRVSDRVVAEMISFSR